MQFADSREAFPEKAALDLDLLFRSQQKRLTHFIAKKVWRSEDVEDIVQATFLEAVRCQDRFAGASKPETWLFGIAVNLVRNHFKQHYSHPQTDEITEELMACLQSELEDNPSELVEYERSLDRTIEAIDALPEDMQRIFNMVVDAEYSYQDTADQVGVPIGTIRSRLSRGRQQLKRCLGL
ncbi:RNA polymerase sigma factor [Pokkaliibacter sp. CJK22405]|uniref:RNA polymerase sigma factor n=1 Tax=Pokkaliibacter sp. CJK22405 TaxID=3384615 RepID=UPI003985610B